MQQRYTRVGSADQVFCSSVKEPAHVLANEALQHGLIIDERQALALSIAVNAAILSTTGAKNPDGASALANVLRTSCNRVKRSSMISADSSRSLGRHLPEHREMGRVPQLSRPLALRDRFLNAGWPCDR